MQYLRPLPRFRQLLGLRLKDRSGVIEVRTDENPRLGPAPHGQSSSGQMKLFHGQDLRCDDYRSAPAVVGPPAKVRESADGQEEQ